MHDHDALSDQEAVERSTYPGPVPWTKFEETVPQCPGMRQSKTRSMLHEELYQAGIVREYIHWPAFDRGQDLRMVVLDLEDHGGY